MIEAGNTSLGGGLPVPSTVMRVHVGYGEPKIPTWVVPLSQRISLSDGPLGTSEYA